ncbi:MAG: hypothetical protein ACTSSP_09840, partial [Candidatus Asgardarchaeia archaeon]
MAKKGPIIRNNPNGNNRHGTNCNDSSRVVVGRHPDDSIAYSRTVQKSVEHYITQYNLKCSLLRFPVKINWRVLLAENKVSNEFLGVFATYIHCWDIVCVKQKLSESFMDQYHDK